MAQLQVDGYEVDGAETVLTPAAMDFLTELHVRFAQTRAELLGRRAEARAATSAARTIEVPPETADIRAADWSVAPAPAALLDRRVEMTGPTERKMTINALNSGAQVWLADMEDASTPHWRNVIGGQVNLYDAIRETITYTSPEGKQYALSQGERRPTIVVRPRGWHLDERHITVDGAVTVGALVDFGLYFFHNAAELLARGAGPYFYLPKLESYLEARLWNDVFTFAESYVGHRARHRPRHRADRDDPGRVPDGGDPVRAARPRLGPERRALGLPVQPDQDVPRLRGGLRAA